MYLRIIVHKIQSNPTRRSAFTLIELSIVLVIIALIVGGILVGQDLIRSAAIRAQVTQIERYNTAVHAFQNKYGYIPGDIPDPYASSFGFKARGQYAGEGDGNGVLEGSWANGAGLNRTCFLAGETALFWVDLSSANLVDGNFTLGTYSQVLGNAPSIVDPYMPAARIGQGNYIIAYSLTLSTSGGWKSQGTNYFSLQTISFLNGNGDLTTTPTLSLTVNQAYSIDKKVDDGLPQSGNITAQFAVQNNMYWASGTTSSAVYGASPGAIAAPLSTTCYDNGGNTSNPMQYSTTQNSGNGANCALTFRMQ